MDPDCSKQRRLQRITPHHALLGSVAGALLGAFPMPLRRGLVRALTSGMDAHAVDVTARGEDRRLARGCAGPGCCAGLQARVALRRSHPASVTLHACARACPGAVFATAACVENGLYMGQTEFEALAAPADWWLLRSLGSRCAMFAAPDDAWFKVRRGPKSGR